MHITSLGLLFLALCLQCELVLAGVKNVVVIGGGMAGITAARTLTNDKLNRYRVQIFEAKRDRYGGRLWTKRNLSANDKKIQGDLGASLINSQVKDNPLISLAEKYELDIETLGPTQLFNSQNGKLYKGLELLEALREAKEIVLSAVSDAQTNNEDISVREVVGRKLSEQGLLEDSLIVQVIQTYVRSYSVPDLSALLYQPDRIDFGYDKFIKFGLTEILDRLVSGCEAEAPLDVYLRHPVRNIEVVKEKNHVLVRSDGRQTVADAVVIAVPLSVIQNDSILFDPKLPHDYYKLFNKLKVVQSERLILEFDEVFWPEDIGSFQITPQKPEDRGMFLSWTNLYKIMNKPYLVASVGHPVAEKFLKMSDKEVTEIALERLKRVFGEDVVRHRNVTQILRSDWLKSLHIGGATVYVPVGNTADLWNIFSEPLCPGLYFAGDYTMFEGLGTLHGAHWSGLRAAEQIMSGFCEKKAAEEAERKRKEAEERKKNKKKTKNKTKTEGEEGGDSETKNNVDASENESVKKDEL